MAFAKFNGYEIAVNPLSCREERVARAVKRAGLAKVVDAKFPVLVLHEEDMEKVLSILESRLSTFGEYTEASSEKNACSEDPLKNKLYVNIHSGLVEMVRATEDITYKDANSGRIEMIPKGIVIVNRGKVLNPELQRDLKDPYWNAGYGLMQVCAREARDI